ncbi:MAG: glycosyltransferase family 39 protein [Deltaproteobacteria bacterium]|nr:glycosyltransferase family 39 protein [Deltaproteobacteria bacterium]
MATAPAGLGRWEKAGVTALIAVPLALFLLVKTHGMGTSNTDENIYFYMARDLARGRLPYVDYFFAHPPLHVLVPGVILAVFGWSFTIAKLFAVVAAAVTGGAIFAIGRRAWGPVAGALAAVLFLFAAEQLKASANMTGVNLTTMWLTLGLWASLRGRGALAGVLLGLAATTGFYSMAAICALLVLLPFRPRDAARPRGLHPGLRQLIAFLLVAGGVNLLFLAVAGDAYVLGVYTFHGLKGLRNDQMVDLFGGDPGFPLSLLHNVAAMASGREFQKELFYQAHLWMGLIVAPLVAIVRFALAPERRPAWAFLSPRRLWRETPGDGAAVLVALVALALFVQYAMFRELYSFYFVLIYPVLALLVAYAITRGGPRRGAGPRLGPRAPARGGGRGDPRRGAPRDVRPLSRLVGELRLRLLERARAGRRAQRLRVPGRAGAARALGRRGGALLGRSPRARRLRAGLSPLPLEQEAHVLDGARDRRLRGLPQRARRDDRRRLDGGPARGAARRPPPRGRRGRHEQQALQDGALDREGLLGRGLRRSPAVRAGAPEHVLRAATPRVAPRDAALLPRRSALGRRRSHVRRGDALRALGAARGRERARRAALPVGVSAVATRPTPSEVASRGANADHPVAHLAACPALPE